MVKPKNTSYTTGRRKERKEITSMEETAAVIDKIAEEKHENSLC